MVVHERKNIISKRILEKDTIRLGFILKGFRIAEVRK